MGQTNQKQEIETLKKPEKDYFIASEDDDLGEEITSEMIYGKNKSIPIPKEDIYGEEIDIINYGDSEEEVIALKSLTKEKCEIVPNAIKDLKSGSKFKFLDSTSQSNSAQLLSTDNNKVFIKFFLTDYLKTLQGQFKKDNSLLIESLIYNLIITRFVSKTISPFFINGKNFVKCGSYNTFKQKVVDSIQTEADGIQVKTWLSKIDKKASAASFDSQVYMLITENLGKYVEFADWISTKYQLKNNVSDNDFASVMIQLSWNLLVLQKLKLRHNDLHFGNIVIQLLEKPEVFSLKLNQQIYKFETIYKLTFIDWDRSAISGIQDYNAYVPNSGIENKFCEIGLGCNFWNQGFDHYFVACLLNDDVEKGFKDDESINKKNLLIEFRKGFLKIEGLRQSPIEPKPEIREFYNLKEKKAIKRPICFLKSNQSEPIIKSSIENWFENSNVKQLLKPVEEKDIKVYSLPSQEKINELWNYVKENLSVFDLQNIKIN